jgi:diacylglycerol kinase (ATP)
MAQPGRDQVSVDLVVNRNARRLGEASGVRRALLDGAAAVGARVHETRSLEELAEAARSIAARGTEAVVLAGGDGSAMAGATALSVAFEGKLPPIALAPGGTVGLLPGNLGVHGSARERAERVMRAVSDPSTPTRETPTLRVRDDTGGDHVAFIFGAGLVAGFFDVYESGPSRGIGRAASLAARIAAGSLVGTALSRRVLSPVPAVLTVDGERRPARAYSLVLASVVRDVGLGVRATYRAGERTDRFHVVASALPVGRLASQIPRVMGGRAMAGEDHVDALAASLRLAFDAAGAYVLDGDSFRARVVTVEAGPVVRVIVA